MKNAVSLQVALLGAALGLTGTAGAQAATNIYLKFSGVTGESTADRHRGEIDVLSFSANASRVDPTFGRFGGGGAGRVNCGQVTVVKSIDQASPQLLGLLFRGAHTAGAVTLTFERAGERPFAFYKIDLYDVTVVSVSQSDPTDATVRESVVLQANQYKYTYTPEAASGAASNPVTFGWDCLKGVAF